MVNPSQRPRKRAWMALFVACLWSVAPLGGCASAPALHAERDSLLPAARDFCSEVAELLDEFSTIASPSYGKSYSEGLEDLASNARTLLRLVERADKDGVDFSAVEALWLKNLGLSAEALVLLIEIDPETVSDDDLETYVGTIISWYEFAESECQGAAA